jgi:hypothetical protein
MHTLDTFRAVFCPTTPRLLASLRELALRRFALRRLALRRLALRRLASRLLAPPRLAVHRLALPHLAPPRLAVRPLLRGGGKPSEVFLVDGGDLSRLIRLACTAKDSRSS